MRTCIFIIFLLLSSVPSFSQEELWVNAKSLNRRTCPSIECGIVGKLYFRERALVIEKKAGWGRVTKYYDANCDLGRSRYVDSGISECTQRNGISKGKFAEWIKLDFLTRDRPTDPGKDAAGLSKIVSQSDDFKYYADEFTSAAIQLMNMNKCTENDFVSMGGWTKSINKGENQYFAYCDGGRQRIYLDVKTGKIYQ